MVRGLISERSYPWAVEPAGLTLDQRHERALRFTTHHLADFPIADPAFFLDEGLCLNYG